MTDKLREAAQRVLYAMAMLIDPEKQEPWQIELYDKTTNALRAALAEQPAEQESMAVACQISALGDSWADFPLERAQEAIEHGLNVRYLGVLRQKPVKPAEQEPVAHINSNGVVHAAGYPWNPEEVLTPLYTTPPDDTALLRQAREALELSRIYIQNAIRRATERGAATDTIRDLNDDLSYHDDTIAALRGRLGEME